MFLDFYKLREQPFGDTPDPRYVYLSGTHREALASLFYGIETGRGFLALIARPGMGKTTLLFHLLERLRNTAHTAFVFQTQCDSRELLGCVLVDLGIDTRGNEFPRLYEQLKQVVISNANAGKRLVIVIDEAQNLEDSALETVRLLSDFERPTSKLMQIVLSGQPELADKLARPSLAQLRQRISILSRLSPFTEAETNAYIDHRLSVAGYVGNQLFTREARAMIAAWSEGIPRNINNLCFNTLTLGCALKRENIDLPLVQEAASDLSLTTFISEQSNLQQPVIAPLPPNTVADSDYDVTKPPAPVSANTISPAVIQTASRRSGQLPQQSPVSPADRRTDSKPAVVANQERLSTAPTIPTLSEFLTHGESGLELKPERVKPVTQNVRQAQPSTIAAPAKTARDEEKKESLTRLLVPAPVRGNPAPGTYAFDFAADEIKIPAWLEPLVRSSSTTSASLETRMPATDEPDANALEPNPVLAEPVETFTSNATRCRIEGITDKLNVPFGIPIGSNYVLSIADSGVKHKWAANAGRDRRSD